MCHGKCDFAFLIMLIIFLCCRNTHALSFGKELCITSAGHIEYSIFTQICCGAEIKPKLTAQACCNDSKLFFTNTHLCCNGQVHDLFIANNSTTDCINNKNNCQQQICCGNKLDKEDEVKCCEEQLVYLNTIQKKDKVALRCCGKEVLNYRTHFCCNKTAIPWKRISSSQVQFKCCNDTHLYDTETEHCIHHKGTKKVIFKYEGFCGNIKYDTKNKSCCIDTLYEIPERDTNNTKNRAFQCCDNILRNTETEECCREHHTGFKTHTIPKNEYIKCCGESYYNTLHQYCISRSHAVQKSPGTELCGDNIIKTGELKCCEKKLHYNSKTHKCCKGRNAGSILKVLSCCNGVGYNKTTEKCCESRKVVKKRTPSDKRCCLVDENEYVTYDSKKREHCLNGSVIVLKPGDKICYLTIYSPKTQICCTVNVFNISSGVNRCCSTTAYNRTTQQCCLNKISNISRTEGRCCGDEAYKFDDKTNPCLQICKTNDTCDSSIQYDTSYQLCCQGVVHANHDHKDCCGRGVIDLNEEECCGDQFRFNKSNKERCCGDREVYSQKHFTCNGVEVIPKKKHLQKLSDVQKLCFASFLNSFTLWPKYACLSTYVISAKIEKVTISKTDLKYTVLLSLINTKNLPRGCIFEVWSGPQNLNLSIEVPRQKYVKFLGKELCITSAGHTEYSAFTHICCGGEIRPKLGAWACCDDSELFSTNTHLCCNGQVHDLFIPNNSITDCINNEDNCQQQICCGNKLVKKDEVICCGGHSVYLNATQNNNKDFLICCGNRVIDKRTDFCCNETVIAWERSSNGNPQFDCCNNMYLYDTEAERCKHHKGSKKVIAKYENFCGDIKYDMRKKSCCIDTLYEIPERDTKNMSMKNLAFQCCDNILWNNETEECCREHHTGFKTHTIPKNKYIKCCGESYYNTSHQYCISGGQTIEKQSNTELCGDQLIQIGELTCCANKHPYNAKTDKCCQGQNSSIIPKKQPCCNGVGYNKTTEICCENKKVVKKRTPSDKQCCPVDENKYVTYDTSKRERCLSGSVIMLRAGDKTCGLTFYSPKTQICCNGNVFNISSGVDECCSATAYNSKTQQCCVYKVSNISPTEGGCCNTEAYKFGDKNNPCLQICKTDEAHDSYKLYDTTYQLCCQGVVHTIGNHDHKDCCGRGVIDLNEEECCGDQFPFNKSNKERCCGDREVYSRKRFTCNGVEVVPKKQHLQKLSDVQKLCFEPFLNSFPLWPKYACLSTYVISAKIDRVRIRNMKKKYAVILFLTNAKKLNRGNRFKDWAGPRGLKVSIEVPRQDHVQCQKKMFNEVHKIILFFSEEVKNAEIKVKADSFILMSKYSDILNKSITSRLSYNFCQEKYNMPSTFPN